MPKTLDYDPNEFATEQEYLDYLDGYAEYWSDYENAKWDLLDTQTWIWD